MYVDFEGEPAIEAAAIAVDQRLNIVGVFHGFAATLQKNSYSTRHVHGLSQSYLEAHGFPTSDELINELKVWLSQWPKALLLANDPGLETRTLERPVHDIGLPRWARRALSPAHQKAVEAKMRAESINGIACPIRNAHGDYCGWPRRRTEADMEKKKSGAHCALYDVYELFCSTNWTVRGYLLMFRW